MKRVKFFVLLIFLFACLYPQENMKSKKALCFNFNGLNLNEFSGGIGGKIWLNDKTALVTSLDFDHSKVEYDLTEYQPEQTSSSSDLEITVGLERHLKLNNRISPYLGLNAGVGYDIYEQERIDTAHTTRIKQEEYMPLFNCILGVEYFITKNISLSGQYNLRFSYASGKRKNWSDDLYREQEYKELNTGIGTSTLILAIYF